MLFFYFVLNPSGSDNPSSLSSAGFPVFSLMFGCGSLHLFPSATRWRLSYDKWGSHPSDHRRWQVQPTYALFWSVLACVTLVDSWELPLHWVSTCPPKVPPFLSSLSVLSTSLTLNPVHQVLIPNDTQSTQMISSFSPSRGDPYTPSFGPPCYLGLPSLPKSVDCSMVILYFTINSQLIIFLSLCV